MRYENSMNDIKTIECFTMDDLIGIICFGKACVFESVP